MSSPALIPFPDDQDGNENSLLPAPLLGASVDADALGQLVHVVLSRFFAEQFGERRRRRELCRVLAYIGRTEFRHNDGSLEPAPDPTLPATYSETPAILRRLGMTLQQLDDAWRLARTRDRIHATLMAEVIAELFGPKIALMVARVIVWGPGETQDRLEVALALESQRLVTMGPRKGQPVSAGAVEALQTALRKLMSVLVELRTAGYPSPLLNAWQTLPKPVDLNRLGAVPALLDRSAPPLIVVRRALTMIEREIGQRKRSKDLQPTLSTHLRDRALIGILACHGTRVTALLAQRVCDYDREHVFPDREVGPAVRIYPGKSVSAALPRWKALPDELADWLDEWIEFAGIADLPEQPLWIGRRGLGGRPKQGRPRRPSQAPMYANSVDAMLRRRLLRAGADRPYSPHTFRHLADQLAQSAGADYLDEHPEGLRHISPGVFGDALLDHVVSSDRLGYLDVQDERGRERWARRAALGVWEYVRGDRGARKGLDVERIEVARNRRDELLAEVTAIEQAVAGIREQRRGLRARALESSDDLGADEMLKVILQLSELDDLLDEDLGRRDVIVTSLAQAESELAAARAAKIPLADDFNDDVQANCEPDQQACAEPVVEFVRDWITVPEAALAFNVAAVTMRRWFRGQMPHPEGDPRNPWQPSEVDEVIERHGPHKRRLIVSRLDRSRIAPEVMKAIKEMLRRPNP